MSSLASVAILGGIALVSLNKSAAVAYFAGVGRSDNDI